MDKEYDSIVETSPGFRTYHNRKVTMVCIMNETKDDALLVHLRAVQ